ncbi:MAG: helix-turn-helix domain-containing protein, partial [Candidatus Nanopelagicales bacterium]
LLAEQGAESLSTRRVSAQAGVTTGAIYRRYDGKGALLADVLLVALAPDRYEWTWELVAALASDDPYWAAADVMTAQLLAASRNEAEQRVLLQIGVAARTDTALRAQIQERVRVASEARCAMCDHLGKAGVIRADIDPAVLAWGFQSEPVGLRAIIPLGIPVDEEAATLSMRAALTAAAAR